ncbi:dihydrodipicolinate synthase family protein, partial [Pseudomonas syringae pv. tagetis]|uniref:dihydrodipicolinate synthase family protein n=1 Tax=Pseudomonas syringae group genomosp. 7 TaxID=251699 RepID=UPI00376F69BF
FSLIAHPVDLPHILYNLPGRKAIDMVPETVAGLSKVNNIIGMKEATGNLQRSKDILASVSSDFLVYSGDVATAVELMLLG